MYFYLHLVQHCEGHIPCVKAEHTKNLLKLKPTEITNMDYFKTYLGLNFDKWYRHIISNDYMLTDFKITWNLFSISSFTQFGRNPNPCTGTSSPLQSYGWFWPHSILTFFHCFQYWLSIINDSPQTTFRAILLSFY